MITPDKEKDSFSRPHLTNDEEINTTLSGKHQTMLQVWQVVAPAHVDQVDFWNALLRHSHLQLERKNVLFILEMPLFPRSLQILTRVIAPQWKVSFVFSEMDRLKTWKALMMKGAPPSVEVIVLDHVITSMLTDKMLSELEIHSPRLQTLIIRTTREITFFSDSRISQTSQQSNRRKEQVLQISRSSRWRSNVIMLGNG